VLLIAKRDYLASVKAKAFLIGLIVAPILFGGGFIGLSLMKAKPDIADRKIAIVDHTGKAAPYIIAAVSERNEEELVDKKSGKQVKPRFSFDVQPAAAVGEVERLRLSDLVRAHDLYAFVEIGSGALHPAEGEDAEKDPANRVDYYPIAGRIDESRSILTDGINSGIRRARLAEAGVAPDRFKDILAPTNIQTMTLISRDEKTGAIGEAKKNKELESFMVPMATMMLLAMIVLASASPMLGAVADDKTQRVFEMLLGSATPFELMLGKVLAAVGLALTSSAVYITGGLFVLQSLALMGLAPVSILPWFLVYLIADVMVLSALGISLGAACGSPHDAQQLAVLLLAPVMVPMFVFMPIIQQPNGAMAIALSLFPPFTPILMMLRQTLPGGIPAWQPWVGLVGVMLWTLGMSWAAARIFRVVLLVQGKAPKISQFVQWAIKG
jgi:ABC-2 type transport system permease protein